jgi:hypothetical protein
MTTLALFDRGAAAYAVCSGVRFLRTIPGDWLLYEFDNTDGRAAEALRQWKAGSAIVNAREFWNALKRLRNATTTTITNGENNDNTALPR